MQDDIIQRGNVSAFPCGDINLEFSPIVLSSDDGFSNRHGTTPTPSPLLRSVICPHVTMERDLVYTSYLSQGPFMIKQPRVKLFSMPIFLLILRLVFADALPNPCKCDALRHPCLVCPSLQAPPPNSTLMHPNIPDEFSRSIEAGGLTEAFMV